MNQEKQKIRITLEKDVKSLGKVKTKALQEGVIDCFDASKEELLQASFLVYEYMFHRDELSLKALEPILGELGTVVVQDSTWKYTEMPLTVGNVENFKEYQEFLKGVFDQPLIKEIRLPENTKEIPAKMCANLQGLEIFRCNEGLKRIGEEAFSGCSRLGVSGEEFVFPESLKSVGRKAFAGTTCFDQDVVFGSQLEILGEGAFSNSGVYGVSLLSSKVGIIPRNCFKNAKNLTAVVLGNDVNVIENGAFEGDLSLEEINLENVEQIGERAFFVEGVSPVKEFNLTNIYYAGKDAFGNTKDSVFVLPDGLDRKMANNAGIPLIKIQTPAQPVIEKKTTSVILKEKDDQRRNAVKQIVTKTQEQENGDLIIIEKMGTSVEDRPNVSEIEVVSDDKTGAVEEKKEDSKKQEKEKKEILRIGGFNFGN